MSVVKLANGRWRVQIRRKSLKVDELFDTAEAAQAAHAAALQSHQETGGRLTLRELWKRYSASMQYADKTENTRRTEQTRVQPVLERLGSFTLDELEADPAPIYEYLDARARVVSPRTKERLSKHSLRLELAALSSLVAFAKKRRLIRENFVSHISRPVGEKRTRRVSKDEQGLLKHYTSNSDPAVAQASRFLLLIRHLGCRPGELRGLLVSDADLDAGEVLFRETKNKTNRRVHVPAEALGLLEWQLQVIAEDCLYVFPTWSTKQRRWVPYNYSSGVNLLRALKVIPEDFIAHAGRREFVSRAIEAGLPLLTIKKATGHKTTQALEIYDEALAVAPGIKSQLNDLADTVQRENLTSVMRAAGFTEQQLIDFIKRTTDPNAGLMTFEKAAQAKKAGRNG